MEKSSGPSKPPRRKDRKNWLFTILLFIFVPTVILVAGEGLLRIFAPQTITSDVLLADPIVDYRLRPNASGHMSSSEYSVSLNINTLGFRGNEISLEKPAGVKRILFLGDSFIFGHGVSDDQTLPFRVGLELNRIMPNTFEVVNGGVYGYCTANEVDFFTEYGIPLKPDLVVILVMLHDVFDNKAWYNLLDDGQLIRKKEKISKFMASRKITKYIPGADWLRGHSHLFKFIGLKALPVLKAGVQATHNTSAENRLSNRNFQELAFYDDPRGHFAVTRALLEKLSKSVNGIGANSVLLTLGGGVPPNAEFLAQQLGQAAQQVGFVDGISLDEILENYKGKQKLFFPKDGHWTATATEFVAPTVATHIMSAFPQE